MADTWWGPFWWKTDGADICGLYETRGTGSAWDEGQHFRFSAGGKLGRALGHRLLGGWEDRSSACQIVEPNLAAGGPWTTPTDLAKFLTGVQREFEGTSHKILNQRTAQLLAKPGLGGWGLGFRVQGRPDNLCLTH